MIIQTRQYLLNGPTVEFQEHNVLFVILFSKTPSGEDKRGASQVEPFDRIPFEE